MAKRPKPIQQLTIAQFESMFPNEGACRAYLQARRWPKGVHCPRCGNTKVYPATNRPFHWQCSACSPTATSYRFSVIAGTIFENTNKSLREWFRVVHLMLTSKKGISALQIQRLMGFGSYSTAHSMCHKIRAALMEPEEKLGGIVEIDETFVGGKDENRHWDKRQRVHGSAGKSIVVGAVKRKGNVIARVIENTKISTLEQFVKQTVASDVSLLCTDQWSGYHRLGWKHKYPHKVINHSEGHHVRQEVVGAIHTNTIEGFWSLVKRGVMGTFHKVSKKYLPLYVAEFQFRYNNRMNADIFGEAVARC